MISEQGQEHGVAELHLWRVPIHIEVRGVAAGRTVFQHIPPPGVLPAADRHMIRDNIEHVAQPVLSQDVTEASVGCSPPQLRIHVVRVHDVIPMGTPRCRLQIGGAIEVAHAELREIIGEGGRLGQPETGMELDPIRSTERLRSHGEAPPGTWGRLRLVLRPYRLSSSR